MARRDHMGNSFRVAAAESDVAESPANWSVPASRRTIRGVKTGARRLWIRVEGTPATILIIEDHRATRTFLADNLSADGYEIIESDCATDAQRLMATKFPDLAIVDLGLPDRDGLELLRQVRDSDRVAGRV